MYPRTGEPSTAVSPHACPQNHTSYLLPSIDHRSAISKHSACLKEWISEHRPANRGPSPLIQCSWLTTAPVRTPHRNVGDVSCSGWKLRAETATTRWPNFALHDPQRKPRSTARHLTVWPLMADFSNLLASLITNHPSLDLLMTIYLDPAPPQQPTPSSPHFAPKKSPCKEEVAALSQPGSSPFRGSSALLHDPAITKQPTRVSSRSRCGISSIGYASFCALIRLFLLSQPCLRRCRLTRCSNIITESEVS